MTPRLEADAEILHQGQSSQEGEVSRKAFE